MVSLELILGLVGGAFSGAGTVGGLALKSRHSREARFEARVDAEIASLREKVEECERERPQLAILKFGVRMLVPELQRLSRIAGEPQNPMLAQVAVAFSALPVDDDGRTLQTLLDQLRREPGVYSPPEYGGGDERSN